MTPRDDKVGECVAYYRKLLAARPQTPESIRQATRSGLQQIIERAGAKRRSEQLLARLDEAFTEAHIVTFPRLTDPTNKPNERIYLFDRSRQMKGLALSRQAFGDQDALRGFILANRHEFDELRGLTDITPEAKLPSGRRIDLLARRPRRKELVGIELKVGEADDRAVGQSQHYVDDLAKEAEKLGLSAHFMLISGGQPNPSVRSRIDSYARSRGVMATLLLHNVTMTLRPHQ